MNHDESRTGELENLGVTVIRFSNMQILAEPKSIIESIDEVVNHLST